MRWRFGVLFQKKGNNFRLGNNQCGNKNHIFKSFCYNEFNGTAEQHRKENLYEKDHSPP